MKIFIKLIFSILIVQQMFAQDQLCPTPLPKQYEALSSGNVVAAYFGNWDVYGANHYQIEKIDAVANKLTHIFYGFMKPDEVEARCKPHDLWADLGAYDDYQTKIGGNFAKLQKLKEKYPHLKIILSIGGGTYNKNFFLLAQDKAKLMKFAQSCVDMLDFYDHSYVVNGVEKRTNHLAYQGLFDGLDIDWEWITSQLDAEKSKLYTQFIQEIARLLRLRNANTMLTMALQVTPAIYNTLELEKIVKSINWFNVMAYDFYGPNSGIVGFNAPLCNNRATYSVDGVLQALIERGISPTKMVLGLPLYGYVYENNAGYKSTIKEKTNVKAIAYHVIKSKYAQNSDFKKGWNAYEKSSSLYSSKDKIFISYDTIDSLVAKAKLALQKKLQGVVFWRLSGDDANHSVIRAVSKTWHENFH